MIKIFKQVLMAFVGVILFCLMAVVFTDVLLRNIFNAPLPWGTEMTELLMGAMAFGSFPLIALNLGHICVELLQLSEDSVFARVINIVASLMTAAVFFILTQQVQVFAERTGRSGEILPQLGLNWEWVWWTIFGFSILTIICALIAAIQQALHIKNRSKKVVAP
ncbi:MAG: TRAP transporter small permease [Rhodobiaceae bacterium]|nr:TRAP transporter small permease [Rhodobiaceae bacterium]